MTKRVDEPALQGARARTHRQRMAELARLGRKISDTEVALEVARQQRASRLYYWHEEGIAVAELAAAAGISRETAYNSIDRYRRTITPNLPGM